MKFSSGLPRRVEAELLDGLAAADPRAERSREDLRRLQRAMGTLSIAVRALDGATQNRAPRTILELGAGDGSMMLRLARRRAARWPSVKLTLLDRLHLVNTATVAGLQDAGWTPDVVAMDVFEWLAKPTIARWDIVFANLFLHHFSPDALDCLLTMIATRSRIFFCCEPRRSILPLAASHLVGLLGAGPVTRVDAVLSVHAGFRAQELSARWPDHHAWQLREYRAGLFSHGFLAVCKGERA